MITIKELYEKNEKFRDYVDEYCENNECSLSEAFKMETVIRKGGDRNNE